MAGAETTREGARSVVLRLSMMHPEGRVVDYDEPVLNNQASYDAACAKLSDRERENGEGWDLVAHLIVQTVDLGTNIETRVLHGKTWEFSGEPAVPPEKPRVEKAEINRQNREEEKPVGNGFQQRLAPAVPEKLRQSDGVIAEPSEAFLLELGELCLKHRLVIEGDGLRLSPFSMKTFRKLLAVEN